MNQSFEEAKSTKQPYTQPTLQKHSRLTDVTEGAVITTVTGGGSGPTPTSTPS